MNRQDIETIVNAFEQAVLAQQTARRLPKWVADSEIQDVNNVRRRRADAAYDAAKATLLRTLCV